jgi:FtsZ-binding cell division protein ZapB
MKFTEQLDAVRKEKESAAQQVAQLKSQIDTLQKENESLKAKASPKKPAAKAPVKK